MKSLSWSRKLLIAAAIVACFGLAARHYRVFPFKKNFLKIPVGFTSAKTPYVQVDIEKRGYLLEIDTGSDSIVVLSKKVLDQIDKQPYGSVSWTDYKGSTYNSILYEIPEMWLGQCRISHPIVKEDAKGFHANSTVSETTPFSDPISGRFGWRILEGLNIVFDFGHQSLFLVRSLRSFPKAMEGFIEVPFELTDTGIVFIVETDMGPLRCLFDTGASISLIRPQFASRKQITTSPEGLNWVKSSYVKIGDLHFSEMAFYLIDFTDKFNIDGALGMDFISEHLFYIDLHEKKVMIRAKT